MPIIHRFFCSAYTLYKTITVGSQTIFHKQAARSEEADCEQTIATFVIVVRFVQRNEICIYIDPWIWGFYGMFLKQMNPIISRSYSHKIFISRVVCLSVYTQLVGAASFDLAKSSEKPAFLI